MPVLLEDIVSYAVVCCVCAHVDREIVVHVVKLGAVTYRLLDMLEEHLQLWRPCDGATLLVRSS